MVQVWEISTGKSVAVLHGHTGQVLSAAFSPDARFVVTASMDGTARIWEVSTGRSVELRGHSEWVTNAAFSPDGKIVVTSGGCEYGKECSDTTVRMWDAKTGQGMAIMRGHTSSVVSVAFSSDGKFIVTLSQDGQAWIWEAKGSGQIRAKIYAKLEPFPVQ
jgi:WD40 repeat protein